MRMIKTNLEIETIRLCPYCKKKKIIKKTCGEPDCQIEHHNKSVKTWWKVNGKVYNGKRRK